MQRASLIIVLLLGLLAGCFFAAPAVLLHHAKVEGIKKYADDRAVLNAVPRSFPDKIVSSGAYMNVIWMDGGGCMAGFPADRYTRDSKKGNMELHHSHYRLWIYPDDDSDAKEWDKVMRLLNETNFYHLVQRAFNATADDIPKQRNMAALQQHLTLLEVKTMMSCAGFENSCIQFDRGDIGGFIIGDPARNKNLFVRMFVNHGQRMIALGIIQEARGQISISDITELILAIKLRPQDAGMASAMQSGINGIPGSRPPK